MESLASLHLKKRVSIPYGLTETFNRMVVKTLCASSDFTYLWRVFDQVIVPNILNYSISLDYFVFSHLKRLRKPSESSGRTPEGFKNVVEVLVKLTHLIQSRQTSEFLREQTRLMRHG